ncbi:MAG: hypothetical protein P8H47_05035 [Candidatus Actinomarina sp.]|nr:hypothetical protein [Candidatus Actinomarina sp.]
MKKIIISLIFFLSFFNGVINDNFSGPQLFETEEVLIEIEEARLDENNLQISWNISGVDNIDQVILIVREFTADGLLNEPLELKDSAASGAKVILWDGSNALSLTIKILSTEYTQFTGPDCDSMFCYKDITTEITSDEKLIPPIPVLPVVPTNTPVVENPILEVEVSSVVDTSTNITFTNELITTIPLFNDIDFTDQEKNSFALVITSGIIILFYGVLLAQEWFNRIIAHYRVRWTSRKSNIKEKTTLERVMEISLVALITALLYAFVEEGFTFDIREENLAIFLGVLFGLVIVTFFYEGIESLIEYYVYDQIVKFDWNPQAMFFAVLSTILFVVIELPFGFILGFIAAIHIVSNRPKAELSPKFYSMMSLSIVGYFFFYATSFESVSSSGVLMAVCKLTYLMCLEGVIFKAVPWGGNELFDAIGDSEGLNQAMPIVSFLIGIWLFIRILVLPPDSEFNEVQQTLLQSGALAYRFMLVLLLYIIIILLLGNFMKKYAELNKPAEYEESLKLNDEDISEFMDDELSDSFNES